MKIRLQLGSGSDSCNDDPAIVFCRPPFERRHDVALLIDIAQNCHPFLIGSKRSKCSELMELSKCEIAFPNLNRIPKAPKLNNVLVDGNVARVEEVRKELRCRTPIRLVVSNFKRKPDEVRLAIESALEKHGFSSMKYQVHKDSAYLNTEWNMDVALGNLCYAVFTEDSELYSVSVSCLSLINIRNKDHNLGLLHYIKQCTGCHIHYPETEFVANAPSALIIEGSDPFCVFLACRILFGLTMFQMSFDMPRNFHIDDAELKRFRCNHLVDVSIEEKMGSNDYCSVVLRTLEFCSNKAYAIHEKIVGRNTNVRKSGYEFIENDLINLLPSDVLENSHLYFVKQPFDPERTYKMFSTCDQFFEHFYGTPGEMARPLIDLPDIHNLSILDQAEHVQKLRSLHARIATSPL